MAENMEIQDERDAQAWLNEKRPDIAQQLKRVSIYVTAMGDIPGFFPARLTGFCLMQVAQIIDPKVNKDSRVDDIKKDLQKVKDQNIEIQKKLSQLIHTKGIERIQEKFRQMTDHPCIETWAAKFDANKDNFSESLSDFRKDNVKDCFNEVFKSEKKQDFEDFFQMFDLFQEARLKYFLINLTYLHNIKDISHNGKTMLVDHELKDMTKDLNILYDVVEEILPPFFAIKALEWDFRKGFGFVPMITTARNNRQGKIISDRLLDKKKKFKILKKIQFMMYGEKPQKEKKSFMRLFRMTDGEEEMTAQLNYKSLVDGPFMKTTRDKKLIYGYLCWKKRFRF